MLGTRAIGVVVDMRMLNKLLSIKENYTDSLQNLLLLQQSMFSNWTDSALMSCLPAAITMYRFYYLSLKLQGM